MLVFHGHVCVVIQIIRAIAEAGIVIAEEESSQEIEEKEISLAERRKNGNSSLKFNKDRFSGLFFCLQSTVFQSK